MSTPLPDLEELAANRLAVLRQLVDSLESSRTALALNDAEVILRGAAHQAELCRQWNCVETQLGQRVQPESRGASREQDSRDRTRTEFQVEWESLLDRIRYLSRVHWSLLRHLERSLNIARHFCQSDDMTYARELSDRASVDHQLRVGG